jgi:hypothetical protein
MKTIGILVGLVGLLTGCAGSGDPYRGGAHGGYGYGGKLGGDPGARVPAATRPGSPADQVVVQTPTGPLLVPRHLAPEVARQHGGTEADIYEPDAFKGQRHSTDGL